MIIRELKVNEVARINEINRQELIVDQYIYHKGKLIVEPVFFDIKEWNTHDLIEYQLRMENIISTKGKVYGAFIKTKLVGLAALDLCKFDNGRVKLDLLYVSYEVRGQGVGKELMDTVKKIAWENQATSLYISATPFTNTVDFYLAQGAVLTKKLNQELYKLEPEDIHLEIFR